MVMVMVLFSILVDDKKEGFLGELRLPSKTEYKSARK